MLWAHAYGRALPVALLTQRGASEGALSHTKIFDPYVPSFATTTTTTLPPSRQSCSRQQQH
eukprot:5720546-Prorocentrum_lima.AAC.1